MSVRACDEERKKRVIELRAVGERRTLSGELGIGHGRFPKPDRLWKWFCGAGRYAKESCVSNSASRIKRAHRANATPVAP